MSEVKSPLTNDIVACSEIWNEFESDCLAKVYGDEIPTNISKLCAEALSRCLKSIPYRPEIRLGHLKEELVAAKQSLKTSNPEDLAGAYFSICGVQQDQGELNMWYSTFWIARKNFGSKPF